MASFESENQGTHASSTGEKISVEGFIEVFLSEMSAYAREVLFYPGEHPRLQARVQSMCENIVSFAKGFGRSFSLQTRDGTIYSDNRPAKPECEAAGRLASLLRERMIQLIRIRSAICAEEVQRLADLLTETGKPEIGGPRDFPLGPSVHIYKFPDTFGDVEDRQSEDEIFKSTDDIVASALDPEYRPKQRTFSQFSEKQVEFIESLDAVEGIKERIDEVYSHGKGSESREAFLTEFFGLLRDDPKINWNDIERFKASADESLSFLEEAQRRASVGGVFPIEFLSTLHDEDNSLGAHLRWRLLRQFVPGELLPPEPRDAIDLGALIHRGAGMSLSSPGFSEVRLLPDGWQAPDLASMASEFMDGIERMGFLAEYTDTVIELALRDEKEERRILRSFLNTVKKTAATGSISLALARTMLEKTSKLGWGLQSRWFIEIVRSLVIPREVLALLTGDDIEMRDVLLRHPPMTLSKPLSFSEGDRVSFCREIFRRLLSPGDDYALDILLHAFTTADRDMVSDRWFGILNEIAVLHGSLEKWVARNAAALCRREAEIFLTNLPMRDLISGMRSRFGRAAPKEQLKFVAALECLNTPEASRILTIALDFRSDWVRKVALGTLGAQKNTGAFEALVGLLQKQNGKKVNEDGAKQICSLLARHQGERGADFLKAVVRERKGLRHRWHKSIRKLARGALVRWSAGKDINGA